MEKIWLKSYDPSVPAEINPDEYSSVIDIFEQSCALYSKQKAYYSLGTILTFQQTEEYVRHFASFLQNDLKLKKGDRIAIMLPNVLQYPIAMYGALRAGLIVVNVNPLYTVPELVHQLNDAGAETILVLENFAKTVESALPSVKLKNIILTRVGDLLHWPKSAVINFVLKYIKKKIPNYNLPSPIFFNDAIAKGKKNIFQKVSLQGDDVAFLQYTGGTTGISKGAVLTQRNLVANILQAEAWFKPIFEPGQEIIITALPLYHIFSLTANCLFQTKIGTYNILISNARDADSMISDMGKFKFTVITGVNTLFNTLLKHPRFHKLDFSKVKISLGGGMSVQRAVADKWQNLVGKPILEAYGLTETSPCVCINPTSSKEFNGTVGLPVSSTEVKILNDEGHEVSTGETGEIVINGPQVMKGYWQSPKETQKVFTPDGWLLTGDIGMMNAQGYLRILERKKDMILVSGFNVYPNEIEDVIAKMPGVHEVAVIGVTDENSGEVPKAFIVLDDPNITIEDVKKYCKANLTAYKIPKHIKFVNDLPKSNVGKVLRRALKTDAPKT